jgi:hypothetical protein
MCGRQAFRGFAKIFLQNIDFHPEYATIRIGKSGIQFVTRSNEFQRKKEETI